MPLLCFDWTCHCLDRSKNNRCGKLFCRELQKIRDIFKKGEGVYDEKTSIFLMFLLAFITSLPHAITFAASKDQLTDAKRAYYAIAEKIIRDYGILTEDEGLTEDMKDWHTLISLILIIIKFLNCTSFIKRQQMIISASMLKKYGAISTEKL